MIDRGVSLEEAVNRTSSWRSQAYIVSYGHNGKVCRRYDTYIRSGSYLEQWRQGGTIMRHEGVTD